MQNKIIASLLLVLFWICTPVIFAESKKIDSDQDLISKSIAHLVEYLKENKEIFKDHAQRPEIIKGLQTPPKEWKLTRDEERKFTRGYASGWIVSAENSKKIELSYHVSHTDTDVDEYTFCYEVEGTEIKFDTWGIAMLHLTPFQLDE